LSVRHQRAVTRRWEERRHAEAHQPHRVAGDVHNRSHHVDGQLVEAGGHRGEDPTPPAAVRPQTVSRGVDRAVQEPGFSRVERVGAVDLGPAPPEPVPIQAERAQVGRSDTHRVEG
jgi:hypothetical protein